MNTATANGTSLKQNKNELQVATCHRFLNGKYVYGYAHLEYALMCISTEGERYE